MMVAGRLLPVLGVAYVGYGLLPADRQEALTETPIGYGGSLRERVEAPIDFGVQVYTGAKIGYALGSHLLGGVFS
jgi:hypothetical protein